MRTATISINQHALKHNLAVVQSLAPKSKVLAMVKSNAYGHGVAACLPALTNADAIGVATMAEAIEARNLGWQKPIVLIEGVFSKTEWQQAIDNNLQCVIHHAQQLDWALTTKSNGFPLKTETTNTIWLKYNTGMNRLGFKTPEEVLNAATKLNKAGYQLILTSHFANADDKSHSLNTQQCEKFSNMLTSIKTSVNENIQGSLCNSAGIVNFSEYHYNWIRPGIILYGSSPICHKTAKALKLQSVMSLHAKIMAVHDLKDGEMVGYGSKWQAKKAARIGIVSIGYGDGYPRVVDDDTWAGIKLPDGNYAKAPIIGRVSMDMLMVDLTKLPNNVGVDSTVILWGEANNNGTNNSHTDTNTVPHIDEVANHANTISYELLCRLTSRPLRICN